MTRKFIEKQLLIATNNKGKVKEIKLLLKPFNIEVLAATDFNIPEPEETGATFIENAEVKARYYSKLTSLPALADDSGLAVNALHGLPGIYSARWAGANKDFNLAMHKIETDLGNNSDTSAKFICALSLCWPDETIVNVQGTVEGNLSFPARGTNGFGYDPIFIPKGYKETFAQMDCTIKEKISHRTDAFIQLTNLVFL